MHLAQGVMKTINVNKLTSAGCKVNMESNRDEFNGGKVKFMWSSEEINSRPHEYWPYCNGRCQKKQASEHNEVFSNYGPKRTRWVDSCPNFLPVHAVCRYLFS